MLKKTSSASGLSCAAFIKASEILLEKDLQHFIKFQNEEVQDEIIKKYIKNGVDECWKIANKREG